MELDSRIIKYMQKRVDYAKLYTCALSVQCFLLAIFFCVYGLVETGLFYSRSQETGRMIIIVCSILLSIALCVFDVLVCLRFREFSDIFPDDIALTQSRETVEAAYKIAKPVLVLKITFSVALILAGGLFHIVLMIIMEKSFMSVIYGRIVCCVLAGIAILIGGPCVDRIENYKVMINERHLSETDIMSKYPYIFAGSICMPLSICTWYIMRSYTEKGDIAWIIFPMIILFAAAFAFLSTYLHSDRENK